MITISNFIQEKLIINKHSKVKELSVKEKIQEVTNLAKEKGLKVVFRNKKMNTGDFCFFIYDKRKKSSYLVGYDGDWDAKEDSNTSFESCYQDTLKFIEDYK